MNEHHEVEKVVARSWVPLKSMAVLVPSSSLAVVPPSADEYNDLVSVTGLSTVETSMLCRGCESANNLVEIPIFRGQVAQHAVRAFSSICVSPILHHATTHGLKYSLEPGAPWEMVESSNPNIELGCCTETIPRRPSEAWFFDEERKIWYWRSESGASRQYYQEVSAL